MKDLYLLLVAPAGEEEDEEDRSPLAKKLDQQRTQSGLAAPYRGGPYTADEGMNFREI